MTDTREPDEIEEDREAMALLREGMTVVHVYNRFWTVRVTRIYSDAEGDWVAWEDDLRGSTGWGRPSGWRAIEDA
jgi:hypothetical protein